MKQSKYIILSLTVFTILSCGAEPETPTVNSVEVEEQVAEKTPQDLLKEAYQLFKEGNDKQSIELANQVLKIGRETQNDTLIGNALTSLCRNAQRSLDTLRLGELSKGLADLSISSGDQKWMMYRAHMNAEMWRLIGNMDRAEGFYNESMAISHDIGAKGMYMIDHFNKSFVATAKGDFEMANNLIKRYYELRKEADPESEDAYGLIALAYLLEQQTNYKGAHEVAIVTRRLFKAQNLFPEPPDEKPLLAVEAKVHETLSAETLNDIKVNSSSKSVSDLLSLYLK